ncbi:MAG: GIY-YIG nuclease family protein [Candidatus Woesearchaeota archaeon]
MYSSLKQVIKEYNKRKVILVLALLTTLNNFFLIVERDIYTNTPMFLIVLSMSTISIFLIYYVISINIQKPIDIEFDITEKPKHLFYIKKIFQDRSKGMGGRIYFFSNNYIRLKNTIKLNNKHTYLKYKNWFIFENFSIKNGILFLKIKTKQILYNSNEYNFYFLHKWYSANKDGSRSLRSSKNFSLKFKNNKLYINVFSVSKPNFINHDAKDLKIIQTDPFYKLGNNYKFFPFKKKYSNNIPESSGIYAWINRYTNELVYIGRTKNFQKRFKQHVRKIKEYADVKKYKNINRNNFENFAFVILYSDVNVDIKKLKKLENFYYIKAGEERLWNHSSPMIIEKYYS